jgi:hypothetical protein
VTYEPPPGTLVRSANVGMVWQNAGDEWTAVAPNGTHWRASWADLDGGKHGDLEWLVPLPLGPDGATAGEWDLLRALAEQITGTTEAMLGQLLRAHASGVLAVVTEAWRRGRRADQAHAGDRITDGGVPGTLETCRKCDGDGLLFRPDDPNAVPAPEPAGRPTLPVIPVSEWYLDPKAATEQLEAALEQARANPAPAVTQEGRAGG